MKRLFLFIAAIMFALSFTSCDDIIKEARADWEKTVLKIEREKIPFRINDYKINGIEVKDIVIDTIVTTYHSDGNIVPCWGYLKTTWTLKKFLGENEYGFLYDEEYVTKTILVELENCGYSSGHPQYTTKWPLNPYNIIKQ